MSKRERLFRDDLSHHERGILRKKRMKLIQTFLTLGVLLGILLAFFKQSQYLTYLAQNLIGFVAFSLIAYTLLVLEMELPESESKGLTLIARMMYVGSVTGMGVTFGGLLALIGTDIPIEGKALASAFVAVTGGLFL